MQDKLLDMKQAASRLEVSKSKIYRLCNSGELPYIQYGNKGRILIYESDLEEFKQSCYITIE